MKTKGKILALVSSGHGLPLKDGKVYAGAGYYLNEVTVPARALMNEGYEITFANPKGDTPQMDVNSAIAQFFGGDEAKLQDYLRFRDSLTGLKNPTRISDVIASGLDQYDAVFVLGGHGPMMDLLDDPDAGKAVASAGRRHCLQRALQRRRCDHLQARLCARLRGYRVKTPRFDVSARSRRLLA